MGEQINAKEKNLVISKTKMGEIILTQSYLFN